MNLYGKGESAIPKQGMTEYAQSLEVFKLLVYFTAN